MRLRRSTRNSESSFEADAAWEAELGRPMDAIAALSPALRGAFEGPAVLIAVDVIGNLLDRLGKVRTPCVL